MSWFLAISYHQRVTKSRWNNAQINHHGVIHFAQKAQTRIFVSLCHRILLNVTFLFDTMQNRKKEKKEIGQISTSSLPDIVFMILFFFMVSTSMKETELVVKFKAPEATEIQKLENKSLVSYIYVGPPVESLQAKFGSAPQIQLNNSFSTPQEIGQFIASERDALNEADRNKMTVCLKADKDTRMGIITDIKQELRKAEAYKISYASLKSVKGY